MIVSMKKAVIALLPEDLEKITEALQSCGEFMPIPTETSSAVKTVSTPALDEEAATALSAYGKYRKKGGLLAPPAEYSEEEFSKEREDVKKAVIKAIELNEKLESANNGLKHCGDELKELEPFLSLECEAEELQDTKYTAVYIGRMPYSEKRQDDPLDTICTEYGISYEAFYESGGMRYFYMPVFREDADAVKAALEQSGFEALALPYKSGTAKKKQAEIQNRISRLEFLKESVCKELEEEAKNAESVELFYDVEKAKSDRNEVPADKTESTVILTGWVRSDRTDKVEKALASASDLYSLTFEDPGEDEQPPSVTKDPYLIDQCSAITDSYSPPGPTDVDPNPFMGPWYYFLFGMMIADVGYGALTAILMFLFKKLKKPRGNAGKLVNVMLYASVPAIFWGVMYGSYFGETWHPVLFAPLEGNNIIPALLLSMIVGVLHLFTGMGIKAYMNFKEGKWIAALADQISWILIITGAGLIFVPQVKIAAYVIAGLGVLLLLIFGGYAKKSVFGKITGGVTSLYGITNYVSDILSYLRIFALALASGLIGMVMNTIAGMITGAIPIPVLNVIVALPIYLIGHGINIALSLLSAYVHAGRLQYIEFFGKFYEGGGIKFTPLQRNNKYTNIISDKNK
ncbi:MAG: V-type ATP synthase subunit I [Clostridia bacterium]|nr:V-type ATP synthase subunit I [Clostridia bacterium]